MKKHDIIPPGQQNYLNWQDSFSTACTALAGPLGITTQAADLATRNGDLHTKFTAITPAQNNAKAAVIAYNNAETDSRAADRLLIRRIKDSANLTPEMSAQLGIIGLEDTTDLTTSQPTLTGKNIPGGGGAEIKFNKSISQGVDIYSKRDGDADFVFLASDTQSPYIDNRPLLQAGKPEMRRYKAIYLKNDAEIGQFSDEIVVSCLP